MFKLSHGCPQHFVQFPAGTHLHLGTKSQPGVKFQNKEESNLQSLTFQLKDQSSMITLTTIHVLQPLNKAASTWNMYLVG